MLDAGFPLRRPSSLPLTIDLPAAADDARRQRCEFYRQEVARRATRLPMFITH
jgi:hypothetical protein